MMGKSPNPKRVIAIDPTSRGFGFAVLESPTNLVYWAIKSVREKDEASILEKVSALIKYYRPEVLVIEDHIKSRRCPRIQNLLTGLGNLASNEGLTCRRFPATRVKKVFRTFHAHTKQEIAQEVAKQLPDLAHHLPPPRKPWMTENYQMPVFDAVALALTYFYSRPVRRGNTAKDASPIISSHDDEGRDDS